MKDSANGKSREENARLIKDRFDELANMLDGLKRMDVGINVIPGEQAADISLYTEFETRADYEAYAEHPAHKALAGFVGEVRSERRVIDYEL